MGKINEYLFYMLANVIRMSFETHTRGTCISDFVKILMIGTIKLIVSINTMADMKNFNFHRLYPISFV